MSRLTEQYKGNNSIPLLNSVCGVDLPRWSIRYESNIRQYLIGDAADRLSAFEDTNLEPSEILALKAENERLRAEIRWIPVTERLPEIGKCVLLRHTYNAFIGEHGEGEYEGITIGYLHQPRDRRYKPYFYYVAVSDYGDMVRAKSICPESEYVTHWMPLPEPPEKGE